MDQKLKPSVCWNPCVFQRQICAITLSRRPILHELLHPNVNMIPKNCVGENSLNPHNSGTKLACFCRQCRSRSDYKFGWSNLEIAMFGLLIYPTGKSSACLFRSLSGKLSWNGTCMGFLSMSLEFKSRLDLLFLLWICFFVRRSL